MAQQLIKNDKRKYSQIHLNISKTNCVSVKKSFLKVRANISTDYAALDRQEMRTLVFETRRSVQQKTKHIEDKHQLLFQNKKYFKSVKIKKNDSYEIKQVIRFNSFSLVSDVSGCL